MRNEVSSKKIWYGLYENAWFPWQPIADLRMGYAYKSTHISAVTYPRLLNLIPNLSLDIGLLSPSCTCKLSNQNQNDPFHNTSNLISHKY